MKKYILPLILFFVCMSCVDEDKSVDPTVMPPATTTGEHTFGCLIDGWLYVGRRYFVPENMSVHENSIESIYFGYHEEEDEITAHVRVKPNLSFIFTIVAPREGGATTYKEASLGTEDLGDGTVTITRFDRERKIISGKFEGGRVTHGRFDVNYRQQQTVIPY